MRSRHLKDIDYPEYNKLPIARLTDTVDWTGLDWTGLLVDWAELETT
jgi:hypothetical protein